MSARDRILAAMEGEVCLCGDDCPTAEVLLAAHEAEVRAALLALATVLEIPRQGNALPLQLRRSYGHADRWAISNREGKCWDREIGWIVDFGGIAEDARMDGARFTLAEAMPLARRLADDTTPPLDTAYADTRGEPGEGQ